MCCNVDYVSIGSSVPETTAGSVTFKSECNCGVREDEVLLSLHGGEPENSSDLYIYILPHSIIIVTTQYDTK